MTADEYVPGDDQVRGRYCDGTYVQTGHTTDGSDFDAWLARVRRDALDRAEHRIARLEAQSGIRGRAVVMYRERAREAEAGVGNWRKQYEQDTDYWADAAEAAEARIEAVRDVHTGTVWPGVADKPICDACDQMWPCDTIRALDN